jgi:methylmalonyl-CoA/ethylmalonyl-CoA epimerase
MSAIKRMNHVAIAVEDIEAALRFWRDALGLEVAHTQDVPEQQTSVAFLPAGNLLIELIRPTSDESGVSRFLKKRGPGIHHICLEVADLSGVLSRLREQGIRLINEQPIVGAEGRRAAFIHPESAHGVLVELYEENPPPSPGAGAATSGDEST